MVQLWYWEQHRRREWEFSFLMFHLAGAPHVLREEDTLWDRGYLTFHREQTESLSAPCKSQPIPGTARAQMQNELGML